MSGLALPLPSHRTPPAGSVTLPLPPSPRRSSLAIPMGAITPAPASNKTAGAAAAQINSPSDEENEDDDEDEEEVVARKKGRKKKAGNAGTVGAAVAAGGGSGGGGTKEGEYKYLSEISQMMFVFGEVQDPLAETVKLVEDIVRGQIIEITTRARLLTHIRSSRFLSAEDLIFLIRDDRGKVNRLRTYLSWKDVRKRAKDDEEGGGDVEVDDAADKAAPKGRKAMVKLPWEILTPFSDFVRALPSKQLREEEDEEDDDEMQAHQDSMQRLRDADEVTKRMTKDEYVHYSDCRQASFTYRKARRFRDFVNFSAYLDTRPNDDIIDILGFLSFEMVRSLCVTALGVRDRLERSSHAPKPGKQPTAVGQGQQRASSGLVPPQPSKNPVHTPVKRRLTGVAPHDPLVSPLKKARVDIVASPEPAVTPEPAEPGTTTVDKGLEKGTDKSNGPPTGPGGPTLIRRQTQTPHAAPVSLFAPPPSARSALLPSHVLEAFAQIQRSEASSRAGGLRNWRGGIGRGRVALV